MGRGAWQIQLVVSSVSPYIPHIPRVCGLEAGGCGINYNIVRCSGIVNGDVTLSNDG